MMDFLFFIKTLVFTLVVVALLQIKIGDARLEDKALMYFRGSDFAAPLDDIVRGGAKAIQDGLKSTKQKIKHKLFDEEEKGSQSEPLLKKREAKNSEASDKEKAPGFRFNWE